jgi:hypothetical protein
MNTPVLHDATLLHLTIDWGNEVKVKVEFRLASATTAVLIARAVRNHICPSRNPWGPSVSVNEFRGPCPLESGGCCVEIEMQSGDTILIEAGAFEWQ